MQAIYSSEGYIRIITDSGIAEIGIHDADGHEWQADVDAILAEHGYRRAGNWAGGLDATAPVEIRERGE